MCDVPLQKQKMSSISSILDPDATRMSEDEISELLMKCKLMSISEVENQIETLESISLKKNIGWCLCGVVTKVSKKYMTVGDLAKKLIKIKIIGNIPPVSSVIIVTNAIGERLVNPYTRDLSFHLTSSPDNCFVVGSTRHLGFCNRVIADKLGKKKKCGIPIDNRTAFGGSCQKHQRTAADNIATAMLSGIDVSQNAVKSSRTSKRKLWEGGKQNAAAERVDECIDATIAKKEEVPETKINPTKKRLFARYGRRPNTSDAT